jgi:hypothetical protein
VTGWLRRAGHLLLEDGRSVTWTVAEGRRGRRWRETVRKRDVDGLRHSLLLEIDPDGRFAHLELSTPEGLLTLHPEGDDTLHGNRVTSRGVVHVRGLAWAPEAIVLVDGSPVSRFAAVPGLARTIEPGGAGSLLVLRIPRDLTLLVATEEVRRTDARRWTFEGPESYILDDDGVLPSAPSPAGWDLEEPS